MPWDSSSQSEGSDQQQNQDMLTMQILRPTSDIKDQKLWRQGPAICVNKPPGDPAGWEILLYELSYKSGV